MNWYIYNFRTKDWEYTTLDRIMVTGDLKDYMVQWPELHGMFDCLVAMGRDPLEAYKECLEKSLEVMERNST